MPLIIVGIIPVVLSLIIGSYPLLYFGTIFVSFGSGDLLMIIKLRKEKSNVFIKGLPNEKSLTNKIGFTICRPKY